METAKLAEKPSLTLTRRFPVAPEKVWRAWTDPQALKQWFGPGGPQGDEHLCAGVYREVVPNRKLVFTWSWPRTTPERESLVTIELRRVAEGTELLFRHEQLFDEKVRDDHRRGWSETLVKLERFVTQDQ